MAVAGVESIAWRRQARLVLGCSVFSSLGLAVFLIVIQASRNQPNTSRRDPFIES
jgi:hypothetical protein